MAERNAKLNTIKPASYGPQKTQTTNYSHRPEFMKPTLARQQLANPLSKQPQQRPHHSGQLPPETLALPVLTRICVALFALAWMAAAAEMNRLVRAKAEEGSGWAGRAESVLVWTQLVGWAKDELPSHFGAAC